MKRKNFLQIIGVGSAALACSYCLDGCQMEDQVISAPTNVDFTLNLSDQANASLKSVGGFVYSSEIIVARTPGGYVALSQACTHQGVTVAYDGGSNTFYCNAHGSRFAVDGSVINGPAGSPLTKYNTSINGSSLRVFS